MSVRNESAKFVLSKSGLSTDSIKASIYAYLTTATDSQRNAGMNWYADAQNEARLMSERSGWSVAACAVVLAHTSIKARWAKNREAAWSILFGEGHVSGTLNGNTIRAISALVSDEPMETLKGPKTRNFARNISGDMTAVTIDIWICRALGFEQKLLNRKGLYGAIADVFREVAVEESISPAQIQAIVWCAITSRETTYR